MSGQDDAGTTRRRAVVAGLAGAAALAALPACGREGPAPTPGPEERRRSAGGGRMPVVFVPHGGGPWPFVDLGFPKAETDELARFLRGVAGMTPGAPRALLVVSAHWEERAPTVTTSVRPPMLYDYYGFPKEAYALTWPAPGDPRLAARVRELLGAAGFETAEDPARGFDHGAFVPLKVAYPGAEIPTVQLSLKAGLDPAEHVAMGRALAPLRDEGVLVLGSGMTFHNLRAFRDASARPTAEAFDASLRASMVLGPAERERRLLAWPEAPFARLAHPREEHLLPLMVAAGAAGDDLAAVAYEGTMMGMRHSGYRFG